MNGDLRVSPQKIILVSSPVTLLSTHQLGKERDDPWVLISYLVRESRGTGGRLTTAHLEGRLAICVDPQPLMARTYPRSRARNLWHRKAPRAGWHQEGIWVD